MNKESGDRILVSNDKENWEEARFYHYPVGGVGVVVIQDGEIEMFKYMKEI